MSDVDREAERKRLREKYERDRADRQVTQQMSELLLKGATMTNQHCEECSNPIFRYQGEEFCPVCQGVVTDAGTADDAAAARTEGSAGGRATEAADASGRGTDGTTRGETAPETEARTTRAEPESRPSPAAETGGTPTVESPATGETTADLAGARASLVRTLADLAERAEGTEDVRRRRDLLAAAGEAADAIAALDRIER